MPVTVDTECRVCKNKRVFNIVDCEVLTFKEAFVSKQCVNCDNSAVTILKVQDTSEIIPQQDTPQKKKTTFFEWVGMSGVLVFWIFIALVIIGFIIDFFSSGGCIQSASVCSGDILGP